MWAKLYGGAGSNTQGGVISDDNGGLILEGSTDGFGEGDYDAILFRINSSGDVLLSRTYGSTSSDKAADIQVFSSGGYVISG